MPRFHFHTDDNRDDDGHIMPDVEAAKCEAVKLAGQIICNQAHEFWDKAEWTMTVTDENGLTQFQLQIVGTESPSVLHSSSSSRRVSR
jgi:hypothetical protein